MIRRILNVALLLVALPLAAGSLPGSRSWRVTLAAHAGTDAAAAAKRLAAMYRGELETPVDAEGTFLIALTEAAAAVLAADPTVQSVQVEGTESVSSSRPVRMPAVVANGSTSWSLGSYSYDGTGNIKKIGTDAYVYDSTNRLVSGTAGGKTEQYTYDEFGNILTITTSGSPMRRLGVDPDSNRMDQTTGVVGGQNVTYDMTAGYDTNGNVTSHLLDQFQYDGLNVLRKAYVASRWRSYVYNASDERIAVIERSSEFGGETRSDWTFRDASGQVLRRLSREAGQWQWNQDYIYRNGQMLASEVAGPAKRYQYHLDHLGTPRLITGNGGVEISRHTYLPFGTEVGVIPGQNPQDAEWKKFTGHERDQGSIDYMHARYYNLFMGRFLSVDPINSATPERPQSWNKYAYAMSNPLKYVDPDGRKAVVRRDGDKIHITVPIRFTGKAATPERIAAFKHAVETTWSGKFGKYDVTTVVTTNGRFLLDNTVRLEQGAGESEARGRRNAVIYTEATPQNQALVDAHETGHLMYMDDHYQRDEKTNTTTPLPGWEGNIMAEFPGVGDDRNIEEVLDRAPVRQDLPPEREQ